MNLEYWANVAEVVGLGLVIVTFVYLSIQIRQNSRSMHSQTAQGIHNTFMEGFKMFCHDDELNRVYRIGILNPDALNDDEEAKFHAFLGYFTASMYNAHHHHVTYAVDRDVTTSWLEGYQQVYNTPGFKRFWPQRKHFYSKKFVEYVESVMTEEEEAVKTEAKTDYKPFTTRDCSEPGGDEKSSEASSSAESTLKKRKKGIKDVPETSKVSHLFGQDQGD